jgi:DNA segregation ATPase FtsK/SpoIIIE-like protein
MFDEATLIAAKTVLLTVPTKDDFASVSLIQRHLKLGYGTALAIMERLHVDGVVTAPDAAGKRYMCNAYSGERDRRFRSIVTGRHAC